MRTLRAASALLRAISDDAAANDVAEYAMILAMLLAVGVAGIRALA